jgi:hypothetical protein
MERVSVKRPVFQGFSTMLRAVPLGPIAVPVSPEIPVLECSPGSLAWEKGEVSPSCPFGRVGVALPDDVS